MTSTGTTPDLTPRRLDTLHRDVAEWFHTHRRDLPWRDPSCSAWGVLVSEIMLQQTPVVRVQPVWEAWMDRWPTPADLASASTAEVITAWGRLGYPRRALRLHDTARAIVTDHNGIVPDDPATLRSLPGIGDYTAAAVSSFAFGIPETVVDTNIRRVHARVIRSVAQPPKNLTAAQMTLARELMPTDQKLANTWNAGVMELGALVCTARSPQCDQCPLIEQCTWVAAGRPALDEAEASKRTAQPWAGTDRQLRGAIMAVLRALPEGTAVARQDLEQRVAATGRLGDHVPSSEQWERCVAGLLADGLATETGTGLRLPA